jgi:hypothetical protein
MTVFWDVMPCSLVEVYWCFTGTVLAYFTCPGRLWGWRVWGMNGFGRGRRSPRIKSALTPFCPQLQLWRGQSILQKINYVTRITCIRDCKSIECKKKYCLLQVPQCKSEILFYVLTEYGRRPSIISFRIYCRVVHWKLTNISHKYIAYNFKVELWAKQETSLKQAAILFYDTWWLLLTWLLCHWRWKQKILPKHRQNSIRLYGVTHKKNKKLIHIVLQCFGNRKELIRVATTV